MAEDYYDILGVSKNATKDEIKRAYRKLAHKYHPDKAGGDEETFKKVNAAYQVLGDDKKRAQYDQFGHTFEYTSGSPGGEPFGFEGFGGFGRHGINIDFENLGGIGDIFESFFGGRGARARAQARRGEDVSVDVTITFEQSALGIKKDIEHRLYLTCERCHGNGAEPGTPIKTCSTCQGTGYETRTRQTAFGTFSQRTVCSVCHGDGRVAETRCSRCKGEGRELRSRTLTVNVPAGIEDKQTIRIQGKGEAPQGGGIPGDLYVTVHVKAHPSIVRDGDDARSEHMISFTDAALGTTIAVETLYGEETVQIPPGTQPETQLRLTNKGFPHLNGSGKGDHIVVIHVEVPKRLSRKQRKLLEELRQTKKGFFS